MLAKIFPCTPSEPGSAQLMVRLRGEQAELSELTFSLCSNEQQYLQPDGSWNSAPHWFTIDGGYSFNGGSAFRIGPSLLDPLLERASQVQIQARLASGETRSTTLQMARDELFSSDARGQTSNYSGSSVLTAPVPTPTQAPAPEPVVVAEPAPAPVEPLPTPAPSVKKRNTALVPMIAAAVLLLLIIAGALWWFMGRDSAPADPVPPVAVAAPAPAEPATATAEPDTQECSTANMTRQSELDFVQNCVQQKLDSDALLTIIQVAKEANKCGVAQRLYANRAQNGDIKVALAYASEYDPQDHKANACFKTADADTAAYWYETVLQTEPDNQKAKQRLEELRK